MPAFVSGLLSLGAKQLAEAKAVVKNLTDVETLGATSAINTDKTGTLTLNQMMVSTLYASGSWFTVDGRGLPQDRRDPVGGRRAGARLHPARRSGWRSTATRSSATTASVIGDPTEAALVVLAAKLGVDAEETRRAYPRLAEVPFDSEYKFMATFHRVTLDGAEHVIELVKGAPDVVLARCTPRRAARSAARRCRSPRRGPASTRPTSGWAQKGLRVLAFAARLVADDELAAMADDPMSLTQGLVVRGDGRHHRPAARRGEERGRDRARGRHRRADDHRRPRGHRPGDRRGARPGSGRDQRRRAAGAQSDDELKQRLPELHVFGRVTPEDKLRLARAMQEQGLIVAMTGDAVNDAAALKQADIGVAMGSGSEVTKQAARMVLTDDNFGTLVHAVEIGRRVYDKVVSYVRYQMTQLLSLVLLFLAATVFDINEGVAMTPSMVLYLLFFATAVGVVIIAVDPGDPDVMHRPPRDPAVPITNRGAVVMWVVYAARAVPRRVRCRWWPGPDEPSTDARQRLDDDDLRRSWAWARCSTRWSTAATRPAG